MHLNTPVFDAWRQAEEAACAAERQLYQLMVQARMIGETPELQKQAASAKLLRQHAHGLFDDAMREMKSLAEARHHRRISGGASALPGAGWHGALVSSPTEGLLKSPGDVAEGR